MSHPKGVPHNVNPRTGRIRKGWWLERAKAREPEIVLGGTLVEDQIDHTGIVDQVMVDRHEAAESTYEPVEEST